MKYIKKALIVAECIGVNFLCMQLPDLKFKLPLFLNAIGTCFACFYAGLPGGLICGTVSGLFMAPLGLQSVFYCLIGAVTAHVINFCLKKEFIYEFLTAVVSGYWIGALCAIFNTAVNMKFNGGYTYNAWGDALIDMLRNYNWSKLFSSLAGSLLVEVVDKQLTMLLFFAVLRCISSYEDKKAQQSIDNTLDKKVKLPENVQEKAAKSVLEDAADKVTAVIVIVSLCLPLVGLHNVSAIDGVEGFADNKGFATQIYSKKDGLLTDSVNVVTQTDDGYIWIGSPKGLLKYDGSGYERVLTDSVTNVSALLCDTGGRLWIGTIGKGLVCYDNGEVISFTVKEGLPSDTVRCLIEKEGIIYAGTSDRICKIDSYKNVSVVNADITYANKMTVAGSIIIGCDWTGSVFALDKDDIPVKIAPVLQNIHISCIKSTSKGVLCGTNGYDIYTLDISENVIGIKGRYTSDLNGINDICEDREGRIWICSENALGYYDTNRNYRRRHFNDADFTYESLYADYQNNMWVTSSKYGLMKLSESNFLYLSERGGLPSKPVNAVAKYDGMYYYGYDFGLKIHNRIGNQQVTNELTEALDGISVRAMAVDTKNRLIVCTYNADGIYIYDGKEVKNINKKDDGLTSNNCRNVILLSDGSLAAGTEEGLNIIKNDKVIKTVTKNDGLNVLQILSLCEGPDGLLYLGTDGSGISVLDNGKIVKSYTASDGLSSDVILRMMPYDDGMIVSTSGKLCYIKGDKVKELEFPYENCYDIIQYNDTNAYILSDEGVTDISLSSLISGSNADMCVYGEYNGLLTDVTANSCNFIDRDGSLVFCTNMGVLLFGDIDRYSSYKYKYGVTQVTCDGKVLSDENGVYEIPKDTKYVSLNASVRDYTLEDMRVKFYVEGQGGDVMHTVSYKNIPPISIYNPKPGTHTVHMQIFDSSENLIDEKTYILSREMKMWEHIWFKVYAIIVFIEAIMMFTISLILFYIFTRRKDELEVVRADLEKSIEEKTSELMQQQMRTVMALSDAIDAKDRYTSGHSARVAFYSRQIAIRLGKSEDEQNMIYRAGLLHDIGKIRVPGSIISKPGRLTEDEYTLMKLHPVTGYHILKSIGGDQIFAQGAHFHHERYDGRGYPNGLIGENIPEIARIIGVADAYDAMSSRRSYHDTFSQEFIRSEIEKGRGTQFDPVIADIMLAMMDEDNLYTMKERDDKRVVLVIDDKQKRIDEIRDIMKDENKYNILGALTGEIGLSILEATNVDLVLLDMTMPGMDGMETLRAIREHYSIPVVFMVEVEQLYEMQLASELGSDDFLTKPYVPIVLKEIVHNYTKTFEQGL